MKFITVSFSSTESNPMLCAVGVAWRADKDLERRWRHRTRRGTDLNYTVSSIESVQLCFRAHRKSIFQRIPNFTSLQQGMHRRCLYRLFVYSASDEDAVSASGGMRDVLTFSFSCCCCCCSGDVIVDVYRERSMPSLAAASARISTAS